MKPQNSRLYECVGCMGSVTFYNTCEINNSLNCLLNYIIVKTYFLTLGELSTDNVLSYGLSGFPDSFSILKRYDSLIHT